MNRLLQALGLMRVSEHERTCVSLRRSLFDSEQKRILWQGQSNEMTAKFKKANTDLAAAREEITKLTDERDEALAGPWPKWASDLLDIVREYTGPCPEDGWEGVDLPEEMRVWLEGYRDEMQRTGGVKRIEMDEWESLKADALAMRRKRERERDRRKGKVNG